MQDQHKITRFGLIRHAQTLWNQQKKIQGQSDSPLSADGEIQTSRWGQGLMQFRWNRILVSDTGRALATANRINAFLKVPLDTDDRLREQDWGRWTGKTISQIKTEEPKALAEQEGAGWDFCPPGGEDRRSVLHRSQRALQEAAAKWTGDRLLVVTHGGVIKSLIYDLYGRKYLPDEPPVIKPYRLHWVVYDNEGFRLEEENALSLS